MHVGSALPTDVTSLFDDDPLGSDHIEQPGFSRWGGLWPTAWANAFRPTGGLEVL